MQRSEKTKIRFNKLQKRLRRDMGQAIADYNMIEEGDRIMVCLSGGKDSYTMLDILLNLKQSAPISFDILAVNLDQKQPDFPEHILPEYLESIDVPYHVIEQDTYSVVKRVIPEGKTTCGLCSRMRRGALYAYAEEHGYNKIALGHHRDDILETFFLNMFHGGQIKAMPAKLKSDNGKHIVIRPLAYSREKDIAEFSALKEYPIIPCNLCGSQTNLQRVQMKAMLNQWDKEFPGRVETIFNSLKNIRPSQLLDGQLFDFENLSQQVVIEKPILQPLVFSAVNVEKAS
ncbi:MAG TPA: tRNA 2-thiocytidine(32) synthetase TtcA [Cycloclasticus sp.]|jgi:tRNA 2-thiocytidine biosynthesis protein TtcA|nr:tRNA 2-thiocytidine(32) synthetase TtcA [Cycloclasticus sp.]HIL92704.1 tRNA 2-thiocytidine(32) synthetase TtcA [Cycloclasticus sp.]